ncbi:cytosolic iron-sulfur assembly component galla-1 isoform X1 [Amblyomma americanum]|uniref:MIP18 family-like domain-containing protein n=1 Tax=Amblyomma americanum TaxID=6943 RepID=A0A0C9SAJ0_AMBAM
MDNADDEAQRLVEEVYDLIKDIRDPEKPYTLEELGVVCEEEIRVSVEKSAYSYVSVTLIPTVSHCHLAAIIGLCVRAKLEENLPYNFKLDIFIKEGSHTTAAELTKQINDKERVAAAMENKNIRDMVCNCVSYETV